MKRRVVRILRVVSLLLLSGVSGGGPGPARGKQMSVKWISHVLDHSPYRGTALLMHMVLADHANDDGLCWPSVSRLAKLCRIRKRRAQQILDQLRDDGMYEAERRAGSSTLFHLLPVGGEEDCTPDLSTGEGDCTQGVNQSAPRGEGDCTQGVKGIAPRTVIEPPEEPSRESSAADPNFWIQTLTAIMNTYYGANPTGDFGKYWKPTSLVSHENGVVTILCENGVEQMIWLNDRKVVAERMLVGERVFAKVEFVRGDGDVDHSKD